MNKQRKNRLIVPSLLTLSLLGAYVYANSSTTGFLNSKTELGEVIVIGTRVKGLLKNNPYSITVLSRKQLDKDPRPDIAQALQDAPGIELQDTNNSGKRVIKIRGEEPGRITVLIDGQELTDHTYHGTPFLENLSDVSKVEVVHGPASVLYGAKAIGGVVNIITKDAGGNGPISGEIGSTYFGESNGWLGHAAIAGTIDRFGYRLSTYKQHNNNLKTPSSSFSSYQTELTNSGNKSQGTSLNLSYTLGDKRNHLVRLKLDSSKLSAKNWSEPAILHEAVVPMDKFEINLPNRDKKKVAFFYDGEDLSNVLKKIHFDLYHQKVKRTFINELIMHPLGDSRYVASLMKDKLPTSVESLIPQVLDAAAPILKPITMEMKNHSNDDLINYGGTVQFDFKLPSNYLIVGANYLADHLETNKLTDLTIRHIPLADQIPLSKVPKEVDKLHPGFYKGYINTWSIFAQDTLDITDDLKATAGLRYYKMQKELQSIDLEKAIPGVISGDKIKESKVVHSASLVYTGILNTSLRLNYSEGYVPPNLMELYMTTDAGGVASLPNPRLKAETSKNIELGVRYDDNQFRLDGSLFLTRSKNYIALRNCLHNPMCGKPSFRPTAIYENVDNAKTYGAELSTSYTIDEHWTPYLNLSMIKRKAHLVHGDTYATDVPTWSGRAGLRYVQQSSQVPFWADVFVRGASRVSTAPELNQANPGGDTPLADLPGWMTVNAAVGIEPKWGDKVKVNFVLQGNNLTNTKYRTSYKALPGAARNITFSTNWQF